MLNLFLAFFSGFLLGSTELISTFQYRKALLKMGSVRILVLFYGSIGAIVYAILCYHKPEYWESPYVALFTGIAPQVLLRSRFTLMRGRTEESQSRLDISLELDKIFTTWIEFIRRRIDEMSLSERRWVIDKLMQKYSAPNRMRNEVLKIIYALQTISKEEQQKIKNEIDEIMEKTEDTEICIYLLAAMAVRRSDFDILKNSLESNMKIKKKVQIRQERPFTPEGYLKENTQFMDRIESWKDKLTNREWAYLNEQILANPGISDNIRATTAVKFLYNRKKIPQQ